MHSVGCLSIGLICLKSQTDVNALDNEHIVLKLYLADGLRD